jgi:hypothetical protein
MDEGDGTEWKIDFFNEDHSVNKRVARRASDCSELATVVREELDTMEPEEQRDLLYDMQYAVLTMADYLQSHLPLADPLLQRLGFLHPRSRLEWKEGITAAAVFVAKEMRRFTEDEILAIQVQLSVYRALREVPDFCDKNDRLDRWWVEVLGQLERVRGEPAEELEKLVKMCFVLAHSQGWVERGFNTSKRFASDRESLSIDSMKSLKLVFTEIKRQGGADKVLITGQLLNTVKMAASDERKATSAEKDRKEKEAASEAAEKEIGRKKKEADDSKKEWESNKKDLEDQLSGIQKYMDDKKKYIQNQLSKATQSKDPYKVKDLMTSIRLATEDKEEKAMKERDVQDKLKSLISKKPK